MRKITSDEIRGLVTDIESQLAPLRRLEDEIQRAQMAIQQDAAHADFFYKSLALDLHNFYTGCERIFQLIASELNGAVPTGQDWHRRLLSRMRTAYKERPAVITTETARSLEEYLAFRHVVRNIYGFELDPQRVERLVTGYPTVWHQFESQMRDFVNWLRTLVDGLEQGE